MKWILPRRKRHRFEPGTSVRILDEYQIAATLDKDGNLDGLPFMPEMRKYFGSKHKVLKSIDFMLVENIGVVRSIANTVILGGLYCDGASHMGCQRTCPILWKEAWLRRADEKVTGKRTIRKMGTECFVEEISDESAPACQLLRLEKASSRVLMSLPLELLVRIKRRLDNRGCTILEDTIWKFACDTPLKSFGLFKQVCTTHGRGLATPTISLALAPGDMVVVRSESEIVRTLDKRGKNRGLTFTPEMRKFCGGRYRVLKRVDRLIHEETGDSRQMKNTVILEGVTCDGSTRFGCPRGCFCLWREIWLRRT